MKQRVFDEVLPEIIQNPRRAFSWLEHDLALDLQEARIRIKELEGLSASQEEALRLFETGKL